MSPLAEKAVIVAIAGLIEAVIVYIIGLFGVEIPAELALAFNTIIAALIVYFVPQLTAGGGPLNKS